MGIIIKNKRHYLTRFPLWLIAIILITLSPFIIGFVGAYLTELILDKPCHEGNCFWGVVPWYGIITLPIGSIGLLIYFIIIIIDSFKIMRKT